MSAEVHFRRLAELLELESEAEARQVIERVQRLPAAQAEASGHALVDLVIHDGHPGLGGRFVVFLRKADRRPLPWNRLGVGTPVILSAGGEGMRGVVSEREAEGLRVALNEPPDEEPGARWRVNVAPDEAARLRQRQGLDRARMASRNRLAELRAVLMGEREPAFGKEEILTPLDSSLNPSQIEAVQFALSAVDVAIIHGPPGTGKTTTVVELIRQAVQRGERVLVCAPSNLAVDNVLERLLAQGENALRLGHPARVLPALREHTLDLRVEAHSDSRAARKLVREAFILFRQASKWTRAKPEPGARAALRQEARSLLADARRMEQQTVESVLNSAPILLSTTTGLDAELLGERTFDLLVIDEACQSTEPGCWVPLARARRVVLAGDHCQLPPTVVSQEAARRGFGVSLLERLVERYGARITRRLDVQYRMHERIMEFSSREFYEGGLIAHESVRAHRLCDLPGVRAEERTERPVWFLDTAGAGLDEMQEPDGESRLNPGEAGYVVRQVKALLDAGLPAADIAVIAPYAAQVRHLRSLLPIEGLEIDSVDGFQGREKEAVVLSLVRSNVEGEIGFLADTRRTNVALTRARRALIVIGDSATLSAHPFYERLVGYFDEVEAHGSVWEEPEG